MTRSLLLITLVLALAGPASAAVVQEIPTTTAAALGDDGTAAVAWRAGDTIGPAQHAQVLLALRAPGATFGAAQVVTATPQLPLDVTGRGQWINGSVGVHVDRADDVLVTWEIEQPDPTDARSTAFQTWGRWRLASGTWAPAVALSGLSEQHALVTMAPSGQTYAAWNPIGQLTTQVAATAPGARVVALNSVPGLGYVAAMDATDAGLALTGDGGPVGGSSFVLVRRALDGTTSSARLAQTSAAAALSGPPLVSAGADGTVTLAWGQFDGRQGTLRAAVVAPDDTAFTPTTVATGAERWQLRALAREPSGRVTLLTTEDPGPDGSAAVGYTLTPGAAPVVSTYPGTYSPAAAADAGGDAVMAWADGAAGRTAGGAFAPLPGIGWDRQSTDMATAVADGRTLIAAAGSDSVLRVSADGGGAQVLDVPRAVTVPDVPRLPWPAPTATLTRRGRLTVSLSCKAAVDCIGTLQVLRGHTTIARRRVHLGARRTRVYVLRVGRSAVLAMRRKALRHVVVRLVAAGPLARGSEERRVGVRTS